MAADILSATLQDRIIEAVETCHEEAEMQEWNWGEIIAIIAGILTIGSVALNIIQYHTRKSHEESLIAHLSQTYDWLYQIARFAQAGQEQLENEATSGVSQREVAYGSMCRITGVADAGRQGVKNFAKKVFGVELTYGKPYDDKVTPTST